MARVFYHKINQEYIADASTIHLLVPLAAVLTHQGEAKMWASTLHVVQLGLGTWTSTVSTPEASMVTTGTSGSIPPASMGDPS